MRVPKVSFRSFKQFSIIFLAVSLAGAFLVHADNPSPNGWNLSGGGFCEGTYTVFNTTSTPNPGLYAENCTNGKNDCFNASDLGALLDNCVIPNMTPGGGTIHLRAGLFSESTAVIMSSCTLGVCRGGYILEGSGPGGISPGAKQNGTIIEAQTNAMTMIEATSSSASVTCTNTGCTGAPVIQGDTIRDLTLFNNGKASVGIDFRMAETATVNRFINLRLTGPNPGGATGTGFTTAMLLDGNEDTVLAYLVFDGGGQPADAVLDLQWQVPLGNIQIDNTFFGGQLNLNIRAQQVSVISSTVSSMKIAGTSGNPTAGVYYLYGNYLGNTQGTCRINLNGATITNLDLDGNFITISSTTVWICGAGTVSSSQYISNDWQFGTGSNWNSGGATLSGQFTSLSNHKGSGTNPTNFPVGFTVDGNGNF